MPYEPDAYVGLARHYSVGRPPYSAELAEVLRRELRLDGRGRLLDVGCGPGVLAIELAPLFDEVLALDPAADMLHDGARRAAAAGVSNIRWIHGVAEDLASLGLAPLRAVTFGQSFHWTKRAEVAEVVYDLLEPGGAMVLVVHTVAGRPEPAGPAFPPIPHEQIERLAEFHLGGRDTRAPTEELYEETLSRTRFGWPRVVWAPGRADLVRDADSVVSGYLSLSWASPRRLGANRAAFEADVRTLLRERSPSSWFRDWPGDTELLIGDKP